MKSKAVYNIAQPRVLLLSILSLLVGCSAQQYVPSQTVLAQTYYANAIKDAEVAEPHEISKNLIAIVPSNTELFWKQDKDNTQVLVVTWTSWDGYDTRVGQPTSLSREVWVTVVPEIKSFCRGMQTEQNNVVLRLEQLLGLPPESGKTKFVEMWVKPTDLFRPSPDPEISDHEAELNFPVSNQFFTVNEQYMRWFDELRQRSYQANGYPWTRLGYTYDWGNTDSEIGLSEFVIRKGATIEVHSVSDTLNYCYSS